MTTFCRITGHARNLPKPCYFPLLPPISPAEAKKLCRITGRAHDLHHYCPIIAFGKPIQFDGVVGCSITRYEDFSYSCPLLVKNKENERSFNYLQEMLTKMKNKKKKKADIDKLYVYHLHDNQSGVIFPPEIEEAIRIGEFDSLSMSKDNTHISVKLKQGRIVKVSLESVPQNDLSSMGNLYYGEGQSKSTLEEQQKVLNERNKRKQETMARKKLFEEKEKKAEEDERKSTQRPKPKPRKIKFDPQRRKEKMEKMERLLLEEKGNRSILLPKYDPVTKNDPDEQLRYEQMLSDIKEAQCVSVNLTVYGCDYDWKTADAAEAEGFDWDSFPHEEIIDPVEVNVSNVTSNIDFVPTEVQPIDIVASVETIKPTPAADLDIYDAISALERQSEKLALTKDVGHNMKEMKAEKILPDISELKKIVESNETQQLGFLVEGDDNASEFVPLDKYKPSKWKAVSGAMIKIGDTEKFIVGQSIKTEQKESFVAGQTIETVKGIKFVPGQTMIKDDKVLFIPGSLILEDGNQSFVAGQVVNTAEGRKFKSGQVVDRGNGQPIFMSGQTVLTEEGPKFIPGEVTLDEEGEEEFIPGVVVPHATGEEFMPGQTFQSDDGITFTPGQIIETDEGPSFIPGKSFQDLEGQRKFVRGNVIQTEDGSVKFEPKTADQAPVIKEDLLIPNEDLCPLAVPERGIAGIIVKPTNTSNVLVGEKLYGNVVETGESVLFYMEGKLPEGAIDEAKSISGQLIVGENVQTFIPGKMIPGTDGEKFVPGQMVCTSHGEEFVPGQLVEATDGPKFIPGQVVSTSEGDKFVPGQVLVEEDGPKFVPGHIIETKNGATFIPGQMMSTDEGQKFVPGQLIDTKEGPMFVPGQVLETSDGPKFLPGTIVETEEGLKYVPSEADDQEDDLEISFQAFDISPEELLLITNPPIETEHVRRHSPISSDVGLINSATLKKLAVDTVEIHGRSPDPVTEKKSKKSGKVAFFAPEEDEGSDVSDDEDSDSDKVDVLKKLMKAASTVSNVKRDRELRGILEFIGSDVSRGVQTAEADAVSYILSNGSDNEDMLKALIADDDQIVADVLSAISDVNNLERNDQVKKVIQNALKSVITRRCDKKINNLIERLTEDPDLLFTDSRAQILLAEAVGIVCITGDVEVATLLEKFISEPTDPDCLKEDKEVLAVLRQLLVLHEVSMHDVEVASMLQDLQTDPENVKDRKKVRQYISKAKKFLRKEEKQNKPFNIRHVASSKDIPTTIFEQLKEDKEQAEKFIEDLPNELISAIMGDKRCGEKLLGTIDSGISGTSAKAMEKFRKGMVVVVAKENMQAVIPRHHARSVCYGIVPYLLIDEDGFKFFERGLTGRKLAPSRVIENTWYEPETHYLNGTYSQQVDTSGQEYTFTVLGQNYGMDNPSLHYTSLLPSEGPRKLSYAESQRRASREGSVASYYPSSRSATPSRRSSVNSFYDGYSSALDNPSRRSSLSSGHYSFSRGFTPSPIDKSLEEETASESSIQNHALVPFVLDDEIEPTPVSRSDTVINLLDKYSNFSVDKEFGSASKCYPKKNYSKHKSSNSAEDPVGNFSKSRKNSRSLGAPDKSRDHHKLNGDIHDSNVKSKRKHHRPFSDIYEIDEAKTPTNENPTSFKDFTGSDKTKTHRNTDYSGLFEADFDEDRYLTSLRQPQGKTTKAGNKSSEKNIATNLASQPKMKPLQSQLSLSDEDVEPRLSCVPSTDSKERRRRRRRYDDITDTLYKPSYLNDTDDPPLYMPIPRRRENPLRKIKLDGDDDDDDDDDNDPVSSLRPYRRSYSRPSTLGLTDSRGTAYPGYGSHMPSSTPRSSTYNSMPPRGPMGPMGPSGPSMPGQYNAGSGPGYMGPQSYGQPNYPGMGYGYGGGMPPSGTYGGSNFPMNNGMGYGGGCPYPRNNFGGGNYGQNFHGGSYESQNYAPPNYSGSQCGGNYGGNSYGGGTYTGSYNAGTTPYSGGSYERSNNRIGVPSTGVIYGSSYGSGGSGIGTASSVLGGRSYGSGRTGSSAYTGSSTQPLTALKYLDDDDGDDDGDDDITTPSYGTKSYNPKSEQRRLATKLAKQYLSNNETYDDDVDDDLE